MNKIVGYTEIKLPDGTIIPLKYGMWTLRELCKKWNVTLKGIQDEIKKRIEEDSLSAFFDLIGIAAEYAAAANGSPRKFTDAEVSQWIDDTGGLAGSPVVPAAMNAFSESLGTGNLPVAEIPADTPTEGNSPAPKKG